MFIATTTPPIFSASPGGAAWPVRDGTMPPLRGLRRFRLGRAINMSPRWAWLALAAAPPAQRRSSAVRLGRIRWKSLLETFPILFVAGLFFLLLPCLSQLIAHHHMVIEQVRYHGHRSIH